MYQMEVSARTGSRKSQMCLCRSSGARSLEGTGCRKEAHPALLLLGAVGEEAELEWVLAPTLPDPCKAGYLQGGKVEKLVDHLVPALLFGDAVFIPVFLGTYRTFTTAHHVLNLLFNRYSHFEDYEEEKAGAQEHLQRAFSFILGSWMREYPEDFTGAPDTSCLQHLVTYLHLNMPGSVEEQQARLLLSQLEHMLLKKPELEAVPPTARLYEKITVQPLAPTPCVEAVLPCQSELELAVASEAPSAPGAAVERQQEPHADGCSDSPRSTVTEEINPPAGQPMAHSLAPSPAPSLDLDLQYSSLVLSNEGRMADPSVPGALSPVVAMALEPAIDAPIHASDEGMPVPTPEAQLPEGQCDPILQPAQEGDASAVQPEPSKPIVVSSSGPELEAPGDESLESVLGPSGEQVESLGPSGEQVESLGSSGEQVESLGPSGEQVESLGPSGEQVESLGPSGEQVESLGSSGEQRESLGPSGDQVESLGPSGEQGESLGPSGEQVESLGPSGEQGESLGPSGKQVQSCPLAGEADCLESGAEQPEPPVQEPLPPSRDVAPVPSVQLEADTGLGGDIHPVTYFEPPVAEDADGVLPCAAEEEPSRPPASAADRPAETDPAPWECVEMEDVQISSRGPSRMELDMMELDSDEETGRVLDWLPEEKADQFSIMAIKLFKKLLPYHLLTYVYVHADQKECLERLAPTLLPILEHCEQVSSCVITTCLGDHSMEAAERAQVVQHWIEVALECHLRKNLSTFVAIVRALQSSQLQGLKKTWRLVCRERVAVYQELRRIHCQEQVYKGRESRYKTFWKKLKRGCKKPQQLEYPEGTVPYLGTILSHLASLHKDQDSKDGSWLNIKRRREEFKVMALVKELQGSCKELEVVPDMKFVSWFNNMNHLNQLESSKLSRELEPPRRVLVLSRNNKRSPPLRKRSGNCQASTRKLSDNGSSQWETNEQLSGGRGSHVPSVHLSCSPKPSSHCNMAKMTEYEGLLPFLSPQPSKRAGHGALS
ncbi:ral guanine nucleotide dissociation stimulator-like isoform X2 [Dipodomys merriami]|uniref:ral guanine nucleotide dissociation stimulator-like isoform X2 n=1 Tax=Dipodomys merriami TaxID=94247 RepID=UPI00385602D1